MLLATAACNFSRSELQKVVRDRQFFSILSWKCASRHSGVHFFDIVTSKSGPKLRCFVHFDFKMCFSPQRRAIFEHLNFKKVLRTPEFFSMFTSKCASRHSGVQFFNISTSKSGPKLRCFVHFHFKMCFSPQRRAIFQHLNFKKRSGDVEMLKNCTPLWREAHFEVNMYKTPQLLTAF